MNVNVKLFGDLSEIAKRSQFSIKGTTDITSLKTKIFEMLPFLKEKKFLIALNKKVITTNQPLADEDEVAFLPPFSGG